MKKFFHIIIHRLGIQGKLTLMFIFLSTIPLLLTTIYIIRTQVNLLQDKASMDIKHDIKELKEKTSLFLSRIETEMLLLPKTAEVKRLMQTLQSRARIDKLVQQDAEQEFIRLLKNTSAYIKVDFLDKKGREVFAISFHEGIPYVVPQHRLLKRPLQYFVYTVKKMNPGETQLTPSEIRHPETEKIIPVINYILPLFNQQNELTAIIVASISAEKFFEILRPFPSDTVKKVLIVNGEGFYLFHSQRKKDWNRFLANQQEENIFQDYPSKIANRILTTNEGTITEDPQRIIEYASIFSSGDSKTSRYIIFEDVATAVLFSSIRPLQTLFFILIITVTGLSVMFGYWIARRFLFPIRQLILGTNIIREGNLDYQINIQSHDEIQDLVASFNQLVAHWREKQALEDKVRESEERYRQLVELSPDAIAIQSENKIIFINKAGTKLFGAKNHEQLIGKSVWDFVHPDYREIVDERYRQMREKGMAVPLIELKFIRLDGAYVNAEVTALPFTYKDKPAIQAIFRDISNRKRIEKEINMLAYAVRSVSECVSVTDMEDNIVFVNDAFLTTYGYEKQEMIGKTIKIIHSPNNPPEVIKKILPATLQGGWQGEILNKQKDGSEFPVFLSSSIINDENGLPIALIGVARDITERKQAEKQLKKSLHEKEILMKEIHHRVKNNLAVVSGLLNMQSTYIKDKKSIDAFKETQARVYSMSMVHSQLYNSDDYTSIAYKEYVKNLVSNVFYASQMSGHIKLHLELDDITFSIDKAIPCGLLLNELVTNALKHAFPKNRKGNIRIIMRSLEDKNCEIIVTDDGVGIPQSFDIKKTKSLGLKLINLMTKQINGTLEIESKKGTEFRIKLNTELGQVIR